MSEIELLEEDFEAAREAINRNPEYGECEEIALQHLAELHARHGEMQFQLRFNLREPRNRVERALVQHWSGEISLDEFLQRTREEKSRPLDLELVRSYYEFLEHLLSLYSRLLQVAIEVEHEQRNPQSWHMKERRADRYAREMLLDVNVPPDHVPRIQELAEEVRLERGLRFAVAKGHTAATAALLTRSLLSHVSDNWKRCRAIAHHSRTDRAYLYATTASSLFYKSTYPTLPTPSELQSLLAEELTALRLTFRKLEHPSAEPNGVQIVSHVHVQPPQVHVAPEIVVNVPAAGAGRRTAAKASNGCTGREVGREQPKHGPVLKNWAVGVGGKQDWWLFHQNLGRWEQRRKLKIPSGNPHTLLSALAEGSGSMSQGVAYALLRARYSDPTKAELTNAIKHALSKVKRAIREAIADCARCDLDNVRNPIPNVRPGWRAAIQIGYAVVNDEKKVVFRTRQKLDAG